MKFSIVTISFNQARYLPEAIESVLAQRKGVDVEYIVVDPGSTDGSREIIERYGRDIDHVVFEPDKGPAHGLNNGFLRATAEILGYVNADDFLLPGALKTVSEAFERHADADVVYGDGWIVDASGARQRRCYSEPFSIDAVAYGMCVVIQPSTFFRRDLYRKTEGFNVRNRGTWDAELLVDLHGAGARFRKVRGELSAFRVYPDSITGSGRLAELQEQYQRDIFCRIKGRAWARFDPIIRELFRWRRLIVQPSAVLERITKGPVIPRQST